MGSISDFMASLFGCSFCSIWNFGINWLGDWILFSLSYGLQKGIKWFIILVNLTSMEGFGLCLDEAGILYLEFRLCHDFIILFFLFLCFVELCVFKPRFGRKKTGVKFYWATIFRSGKWVLFLIYSPFLCGNQSGVITVNGEADVQNNNTNHTTICLHGKNRLVKRC